MGGAWRGQELSACLRLAPQPRAGSALHCAAVPVPRERYSRNGIYGASRIGTASSWESSAGKKPDSRSHSEDLRRCQHRPTAVAALTAPALLLSASRNRHLHSNGWTFSRGRGGGAERSAAEGCSRFRRGAGSSQPGRRKRVAGPQLAGSGPCARVVCVQKSGAHMHSALSSLVEGWERVLYCLHGTTKKFSFYLVLPLSQYCHQDQRMQLSLLPCSF